MTVLKEFSLTIPEDKIKQRGFELQTRCVLSLYERLFPKFKTHDSLITESPDEWAYTCRLGALTWESESCVILKNKAKDKIWRVEL